MDEKCFADGCPGTAKFSCSCDVKLQICQEHIAEHIRGLHNHVICASNRAQEKSKRRTNIAISTLNSLNTRALTEGKGMFKELCDKLCTIVDELTKRQQSLVDLSALNYSQEVEDQIQELVTVNIAFRDKSDFKKLLDKFMAPGGETFDSLSLEDFKKDFSGILECLNQSNRVLESVTGTHKEEQALRKELENRVENLEKGKIQNIDQRLQRFEQEAQAHAKMIEDLRKSLEKNDDKVEAADKRLKDTWDKIQKLSKNQMDQFQALENGIRKSAEDNNLALNKKYKELNEKFGEIKQIKDSDFKKILEKLINEVHDRRIVRQN